MQRRAAVEDERAGRLRLLDAGRSRRPRSRSAPGSRAPASTTVTAASSALAQRRLGRASPAAAAASASSRSPSSRGSSTCVSGSPKRALNSSTRGPSSVSISPAKRHADERRAAARELVDARAGGSASTSSAASSSHGTGEYAPMPPVFGPSSPSPARLKSCAAPSGTARAAVAEREERHLAALEQLLDRRAAAERRRRRAAPRSSSSAVRQTKTPLPAASPSALTTHGGRATGERRRRRHAGRRACTSFAKVFEPSIARRLGARARRRRSPACRSSSATPGDERRLRADHDEVGAERRARGRAARRRRRRARDGSRRARRSRGCRAPRAAPSSDGLRASCHASACSRAPDPTRSTFTTRRD